MKLINRCLVLVFMALAVNTITPNVSYADGEGRDTLYKYIDTVKVLYDKIDTTAAKIPTATVADSAKVVDTSAVRLTSKILLALKTYPEIWNKIDTTTAKINTAALADSSVSTGRTLSIKPTPSVTTLLDNTTFFGADTSASANIDTVSRCIAAMIKYDYSRGQLILKETASPLKRVFYSGAKGISGSDELFHGIISDGESVVLAKFRNDGDYCTVDVSTPRGKQAYMRVNVFYYGGNVTTHYEQRYQ